MSRPIEYGDRVTTNVRLPVEMHSRLHEEAKAREVSVNWLILRLLDHGLDRLVPADEIVVVRPDGDAA